MASETTATASTASPRESAGIAPKIPELAKLHKKLNYIFQL